jgi:Asp-tRNA(Asn)/Glu-tRNA(Gln) amidotransferase A subunit family amidase
MTDILSSKVEDIVSRIKDAQLTSVEVCETYIERIKKFEKDVKAWVYFDKKLLLEKAKEADEHRRAGKPTGPLHGIPVALKDIIGTIDMPTECGTPIRKGKSYSQNAEIIDLLLSAGAIVMGKTATSELAYLGPSKTTNPHDYSRTPGGSQVDLQLRLLLLWHHYQLVLKLEAQLLDLHLIVVLLDINQRMD